MYEDIQKNKFKTGLIVSFFVIFVSVIIYAVCLYFDLGPVSIVIAFIASAISAYASYYNSDKIVLAVNNARPATKEENLKLVNILEGLTVSTGLKTIPKLYIMDDAQPNAFATGRDPDHSVICVTSGLLEKLDYYELEGVVAHELAHINNYDILLSTIISVMVGFVLILSDFFFRFSFRKNPKSNNNSEKFEIIIIILGLICLLLSPIVSQLIQLAVSRRREYLADATAIKFTRNPDGLISALRKLDADQDPLDVSCKSTDHMYIVSPLKGKRSSSSIFSTHPSIEDRIKALQELK